MKRKVNILVTGAKGQLGSEIAAIHSAFNTYEFHFQDKKSLDITDPESLNNFFQQFKVHYVINCAAYTNVDKAEKEEKLCNAINAEGPRNLATVCKENKARLIHISSDYVYNPLHDYVNTETEECNPQGIYAKSKLRGELNITENLAEHIILRTSWVYSSFGHNFVKTMLRLSETKQELSIVSDQIGSPTFAKDLANTIMEIIAKLENTNELSPFWGTYNYSNLGFISWAEFASAIFQLKKIKMSISAIPSSSYPTAAPRPFNSRLSKSKITETFSLSLKQWKKSLKKCLEEIDN